MTVGKALGVHDLTLESDDSASPTTSLGLMLATDKTGKRLWKESRLPPFPVRQSQGAVGYAHKDPSRDLVFSQRDWSGGALAPLVGAEESNRYASANGCDLRWEGVATLGMKKAIVDFLLRNAGAELGATTGWTAQSGTTVTAPAGAARTGSYGFRLVTDGNNGTNTTLVNQDLTNASVFQGRTITVIAYLRRTSGTESGVKLGIYDDGGGGSYTYSAAITAATYTYVTVTRAIHAAATIVRVALAQDGNETGAHTFEVDDITIIPAGGIVCKGVAVDGDALYGIFGRMICQWDETNDIWNAVYVAASAFNSIVQYGGNLYAAFADGTAYIYGSTTSWTTSTILAPGQDANFFRVSRGTLWKGILASIDSTNHGIFSSTNPVNGGSWSTVYTLGSVDTDITGLYDIADTLAVGKEEGLHVYKRVYNDGTSADLFENLTNEYLVAQHADNFSKGAEFHGWLYLVTAQQGLLRYRPGQIEDISSLFFAPRLSDFGGKVRAMASEPAQLWLLVDTPTTDTTDAKTTWLMSLRETSKGILLHTIEQVSIGDINALAVHNGYLWAMGRSYVTDATDYQASLYRWTLPTKTIAPAFDSSPVINTSGSFRTSKWDGGMPDEQKALIALTIFTKPSTLDAEHTIVVKFGTNDAAASTTTLGTFSGTGAIQTKYFDGITTPETNAVARSVQLEFTLASDDTVSPQLYAFALHATLRPERVKTWEILVQVGAGVVMNGPGLVDPEDKATKLSKLSTLEIQVYPIEMTEAFVGLDTTTTHRVQIVPGSLERQPQEERHEGIEVYRLMLQEVTVA